jgi:hypothetical protein
VFIKGPDGLKEREQRHPDDNWRTFEELNYCQNCRVKETVDKYSLGKGIR